MNAGERRRCRGAVGRLVSRLSELKIHPELVPQLIISRLNLWYCEGTFVPPVSRREYSCNLIHGEDAGLEEKEEEEVEGVNSV